tara:strand:- start:495 stop:1241 length:747 start_codon:yes stop_codon:yes gene_type:complete
VIYSTDAIVLNNKKFSDSSLICNLYSKDYGKLSIIAKGVRKLKNLNGAILQPFNHIQLVYYYKSKRNIQTYKEASIIQRYNDITNSYDKIILSSVMLDIINYSSIEDNPCDIIFRLINKSLEKINSSNSNHIVYYFIFFNIQLLIYLGYKPLIEKCYNCNQRLKNGFFNYTSGQLECSKCANSKIELNSNSIRLINLFFNTHIDKIKQLFKLDEQSLNNINKYFFHYILHHIPNMKKSKAYMNYNQKI